MSPAPVIVLLSEAGREVAARICELLEDAEIHGWSGRVSQAAARFDSLPAHLQALFAEGRPIIGICSAGILIRALAPGLRDKTAEPPVIAVSQTGSSVVPLLGGHRGANRLAREIAGRLGTDAAITTAGDERLGVALDAPPEGWTLANPGDAKTVMAALLEGQPARICGSAPWLEGAALPRGEQAAIELLATVEAVPGAPLRLVYHPHVLALGVGCERGCAAEELITLVEETLTAHNLSRHAIACVASLALKADEPAVHALAEHLGVPARFFGAEALNALAPRLANPSDVVMRETGCPGVAEGAALAAGGAQAALCVEKVKSARATCALARAPAPIDPAQVGRARGRLSVVGIGPGSSAARSREAEAALRMADDWVGYGLYLDLAADLARGQRLHAYALGDETQRCRDALELAGEGRNVALICSGDAGIYAMASLVFELLDPESDLPGVSDAARRAAVEVIPGISALQAGAARAGAPLGHDFCAISLSDLLTPWAEIEARLEAAARADFVTALYNPRSMRRKSQLERAIALFRAHRPPGTPVIVATNIGRAGERVETFTLSRFDPEVVDMLTLVIVGSSRTRRAGPGDGAPVYTPRGYAAKEAGQ